MQRNEELTKLAAARGLVVSGPNCAGMIHLDPTWRFAATFLRGLPPGAAAGARNGLAFISQSRTFAEEIIDKANARGPALHRIDRGPRTLPPRSARRVGPQTSDRLFGSRTEAEEMAEVAGLIARYPRLRDGTRSDNLSDLRFHDRRGS